jgi:hypothetical protein
MIVYRSSICRPRIESQFSIPEQQVIFANMFILLWRILKFCYLRSNNLRLDSVLHLWQDHHTRV